MLTSSLLLALLPAQAQGASGEQVLTEARCVACHVDVVGARAAPPAPVLDRVAERRTAGYLRRFLSDPAATRPGTPMPDLLRAQGPGERERAVEALVHFLASDGAADDSPARLADPSEIERGRALFHRIGCAACHAPFEDAASLEQQVWSFEELGLAAEASATADASAPLGDAREDWTGSGLVAFLLDPLAYHPDGRMPSLALTAAEASDLATCLAFESAVPRGVEWTRAPGVAYEYFEADYGNAGPAFEALTPARTGVVAHLDELPEHAEDYFGFRFRAMVEVPRAGSWTFTLTSDDGSMLWVDGTLEIDNGGAHAAVERRGEVFLEAGTHALELTYFELTGDIAFELLWEGPGTPEGPLPAGAPEHWTLDLGALERTAPIAVDPGLATEGRVLFERLGCASCHAREGIEPVPVERTLDDLVEAGGVECDGPRYALEAERSAALAAHLAAGAPTPRRPERLLDAMERLRCTACHVRDGRGGPAGDRRALFVSAGEVDLGDHGRFPPDLTGVGAKLTAEWLGEVMLAEGRVRPYVRTRMPSYGPDNVAGLVELLPEVDATALAADAAAPPTPMSSAELGRELAGSAGLGCVQCHHFDGNEASGGPALDLAGTTERIRPAWFRHMLLDPPSVGMESRMPTLWKDGRSPVTDVLGGDPAAQTDALWSWLARAPSLALPEGLVMADSDFELIVGDEPRMVAVFMSGVSPRTLLVGYPEGLHVAFDVAGSRLVSAWRGRFFNAVGTWHGRAGGLERPGWGDDLELPPGPPLARLEAHDAPWPEELGRAAGYRVLGRRFDRQRRPVFRYALGTVVVEELAHPRAHDGGHRLVRELELSSDEAADDLWLRAAVGASIEPLDGGFEVDGRVRIRLAEPRATIVTGTAGDELRIPVPLEAGGVARVELEIEW